MLLFDTYGNARSIAATSTAHIVSMINSFFSRTMYATNISNGFLFLKSIFSGELTPLLIHLLREPGIETIVETMLFRFFRGEPTPFFAFFALARFGTMVETACASHPGSLCYIGAKSMPAPIGVSIARPILIMFLPDGK